VQPLERVRAFLRPAAWPDHLVVGPRLRRASFVAKVRFRAWRAHAEVELRLAPDVAIGRRVEVEIGAWSRTTVSIGARSMLGDGVHLRLRGGSLRLGEQVDVRGGAVLDVGGGDLYLEGPNNLSWGVVIHCAESVRLARFAHVAEYSTIVDSSHYYTAPDEWSYYNTRTDPVSLGEDVWVCPKSTIIGGVTIGDHTIVASNSVVIKDVESGMLVSGVPAKVVRALDLPWRRTEEVDSGRSEP
jgi:acetyltransferase-like isoleucine patch superfamily enzyme